MINVKRLIDQTQKDANIQQITKFTRCQYRRTYEFCLYRELLFSLLRDTTEADERLTIAKINIGFVTLRKLVNGKPTRIHLPRQLMSYQLAIDDINIL